MKGDGSEAMVVSLIGMAGTGKSFWSKRLAGELGFIDIHCDDLIAQRLIPVIGEDVSEVSVGRWMGMPYQESYQAAAKTYLGHETDILKETIASLSNGAFTGKNVVIDTTGSVIHTPSEIYKQLKFLTTVVYLETPEAEVARLYQNYLLRPRSIYWDKFYVPLEGEDPKLALARCYKELIAKRRALYHELADVIIPFSQYRKGSLTASDFLELIKQA